MKFDFCILEEGIYITDNVIEAADIFAAKKAILKKYPLPEAFIAVAPAELTSLTIADLETYGLNKNAVEMLYDDFYSLPEFELAADGYFYIGQDYNHPQKIAGFIELTNGQGDEWIKEHQED